MTSPTPEKIKLAQFFRNNTELWFKIAEGQFRLNHVTSDADQYDVVISRIEEDILETVADIIANPPNEGEKFNTIKNALITRNSTSSEARLKHLLSGSLMIGDDKPSTFYRRLTLKSGSLAAVNTELLRSIWLQNLPNELQPFLATWSTEGIDKQCQIADQIWEVQSTNNSKNVSAIQSSSISDNNNVINTTTNVDYLIKRIESLETQLANQNRRSRSHQRYQFQRNNSRSNSRRRTYDNGICFYHNRYAEQAQYK